MKNVFDLYIVKQHQKMDIKVKYTMPNCSVVHPIILRISEDTLEKDFYEEASKHLKKTVTIVSIKRYIRTSVCPTLVRKFADWDRETRHLDD